MSGDCGAAQRRLLEQRWQDRSEVRHARVRCDSDQGEHLLICCVERLHADQSDTFFAKGLDDVDERPDVQPVRRRKAIVEHPSKRRRSNRYERVQAFCDFVLRGADAPLRRSCVKESDRLFVRHLHRAGDDRWLLDTCAFNRVCAGCVELRRQI